MKLFLRLIVLSLFVGSTISSSAQIDDNELGAWYMYFWNTSYKETGLGLQGDVQFRNWNLGGDLEQLLLRGGFTYVPKGTKAKFTLGYANITTGEYGEGNSTVGEHRIYQEALIPHSVGERFKLTHRYRFEQRFVDDQDLRTRLRYNLFVNIPLNKSNLEKGAVYIALYNELFVNAQRSTGNGEVELFDRNRLYTGLGYSLRDNLRMQLAFMEQTTNSWSKGQLQVSLHHKF